jgi:capsular polysaccharide biosynthesis protein
MEIRAIVRLIAKWWILIAAIAAVSVIGAAVVSFYFTQNVYESSAVMIIGSPRDALQQNQMTLNDYTLNLKLVDSYRVLCKTDKILNEVIADTKLPLTVKELSDKINVTAQSDTDIIDIAVQDTDPQRASVLANAVATVFVEEIPGIMQMNNVQIIDNATVPKTPVKPDRKMIILLAGLVGLLLGAGIAFLIEYFDVTVKSDSQLSELLGAPVLGMIPQLNERGK